MANRVCWNCEITANQKFVGVPLSAKPKGEDGWKSLRIFHAANCDSCGCASLAEIAVSQQALSDWMARTYSWENARSEPTESDYRKRVTDYFDSGVQALVWHPAYAQGKDFPDVPEYVASPASEAWACFNVGLYRAAAVMARAVVEATAKDKGAEPRDDLVKKIRFLGDSDHLSRRALAAADEVRLSGNVAAHGDPVEPITEETCRSLLLFMEMVLHDVYQAEADLARVRELRKDGRAMLTD